MWLKNMKRKPLIVWLVDGQGWGWDNFSQSCIKYLNDFRHIFLHRHRRSELCVDETYRHFSKRVLVLKPDCVVAMHPAFYCAMDALNEIPTLARLGMKVSGRIQDATYREHITM